MEDLQARSPKLSVVVIAKTEAELQPLLELLRRQTYPNFEIVMSTRGTAPQAWNDAISRATGDYLVFTESDARPVGEDWLARIAEHVHPGCVMKGLEIRPTSLNLCNTVFDASIFMTRRLRFREDFTVCEDTELFARLRSLGVVPTFVNDFPVIHVQKVSWHNTFRRALRQGLCFARIAYMYGTASMDTCNTQSFWSTRIHPVSNRIREMCHNLLVLIGLFFGLFIYLPIALRKKVHNA